MKADEKNLSTQQSPSQTHAWLPGSHENCRRPRSHKETTGQRPQTSHRDDPTEAGARLRSRSGPHGLPKAARLLARRDFLSLQRRGKRRRSPHFIVVSAPTRRGRTRLGITVTRRFGKAVIRNRMKRRLREFFRMRRTRIVPYRDIVVIPRAQAHTLTFAEMAAELEPLLRIGRTTD